MIQPKERPILFSAPMVRAILAGQKTVTRRVLNATAIRDIGYGARLGECYDLPTSGPIDENSLSYIVDFCPYGQPGDRLWVRETTEIDEKTSPVVTLARYAADGQPVIYRSREDHEYDGTVAHWDYPRRTRPSIHMPRWASRILLEITSVSVGRLQAITTEQALDEGIGDHRPTCDRPVESDGYPACSCGSVGYVDAFAHLWNSINGASAWDSNPWVWVVEFKRVMPCPS